MSLLSFTIMSRVNFKLGFLLLTPLILFGIFSVLHWHWTELSGHGDIRLYGMVQFYTMFLLIFILFLFPKSYPPSKAYFGMFIFYLLAKVSEHFDLIIYKLNVQISGHTINIYSQR